MVQDIERVVDCFIDTYSEDLSVSLLSAVARAENGGLGYQIKLERMIDLDGYEFSEKTKTITLDSSNYWSDMSV